jgi:hypothetical protein
MEIYTEIFFDHVASAQEKCNLVNNILLSPLNTNILIYNFVSRCLYLSKKSLCAVFKRPLYWVLGIYASRPYISAGVNTKLCGLRHICMKASSNGNVRPEWAAYILMTLS